MASNLCYMSNIMNIDHLRHKYGITGFTKADLLEDPLQQFDLWFKEAVDAQIIEVNTMNLATSGNDGQPAIRAVLLKSYDERGFVFYTNYESRKAKAIEENPKVAVQFLWVSLGRQIRIEGMAKKISTQESEDYFKSRPRDSQISAWASHQSDIVSSRKQLEDEFLKYSEKFHGKPIPLPPFWGGYRIKASSYEFWQGQSNRLHDRVLYKVKDKKWVKNRLAP